MQTSKQTFLNFDFDIRFISSIESLLLHVSVRGWTWLGRRQLSGGESRTGTICLQFHYLQLFSLSVRVTCSRAILGARARRTRRSIKLGDDSGFGCSCLTAARLLGELWDLRGPDSDRLLRDGGLLEFELVLIDFSVLNL